MFFILAHVYQKDPVNNICSATFISNFINLIYWKIDKLTHDNDVAISHL
jgi:hypothetical protein